MSPAANSRPIFVVGAPRTGTTLVRDILNRHPHIHLFDEVHFFERIWDERARWGDLSKEESRRAAIHRLRGIVQEFGSDKEVAVQLTPEAFEERMMQEGGGYSGLLAALLKTGAELKGASSWGDSSPQDVLYLPKIFEWFPDARVVALVRDPRDFLSSYKNYHRRGVPTYRERYNPLMNSILWRTSMTAVLEAGSEPWAAAVLRLRYEDLVGDPQAYVREAVRACRRRLRPEHARCSALEFIIHARCRNERKPRDHPCVRRPLENRPHPDRDLDRGEDHRKVHGRIRI